MKLTTKEKMLKALTNSRGRVAFTTAQARRRFGIAGVTQRIAELRADGNVIKSKTTYVRGKAVTGYYLPR